MNNLKAALVAVLLIILPVVGPAQTFSSGSTGIDGAYSPTVSGDFDPAALGINAAGDNVFHFTTINIPAGVTIRLRASKVRNLPVVWLATGNVTIAGTLNLAGETGHYLDLSLPYSAYLASRNPAEPGAGGYYGGLGAKNGVAPEVGAGPGGGPAGVVSGGLTNGNLCYGGAGSGFVAAPTSYRDAGQPYGNGVAVPLYGGSGGGGAWGSVTASVGGGGGGGGGAIRVLSSTQIAVTGSIDARGGNGGLVIASSGSCTGGPGAAGTVNLIAPTVVGNGSIYVASGYITRDDGYLIANVNPQGVIRFGTANMAFTGTAIGGLIAPLYTAPSNINQPTLRITQINGAAVPAFPLGLLSQLDVQISANTPATVNVSATNVPVGTVPTLRVTGEAAGDQVVTCNALSGTLAASTTTCTATFPFAVSIAGLRATF